MELILADLSFIFFIFPGLLFSIILIFIWLFVGNYLLQKIDGNQEASIFNLINNYVMTFNKQNPDIRFSKGFFYLFLEIATFFTLQLTMLNDFFSNSKNNTFLLLLLIVLCLTFEMLYQLDLGATFIFIGKIISIIVILVSFGFVLIISKSNSFNVLSQSMTNNNFYLSLFLFLIILFSISKLNTFMDYKKTPVYHLLPNDLNLYVFKIENGNVSEKYVRWLNEAYSQIVLTQLVVLIMFPTLQSILNIQGPIWIQYFIILLFQVVLLLLTLILSLLNPVMEFKIPNSQSKVLVLLLFVIGLLIVQ